MLYMSYGKSKSDIIFKIDIEKEVLFEIDKMIYVGLIVTEIISNSLKYAFPKNKGKINISFANNALLISDNGVGYISKTGIAKNTTLGMQLIFMLSEQMDCKVKQITKGGVSYSIRF